MIVIQIFGQLFFAPGVVGIFPPYFYFNDKLFSLIINNDIRSFQVAGSCFDIVIPASIQYRL